MCQTRRTTITVKSTAAAVVGGSLYVVGASGEVALKPVTVKSYESNDVVISGGVDDGAKVIALGVQKLDPAQKVRVVSSLSF